MERVKMGLCNAAYGIGRKERVEGAVLGHAVGDALGVPVEFLPRHVLESDPVTDMRGYGTHHQPPGTWSDDTSLMLCLLENLKSPLDLYRLARSFIDWRDSAYMTPHGAMFDIGIATDKAISRLKSGVPPVEAGGNGEYDNGNGSLMRILPVSFLDLPTDEEMVGVAHNVSRLTHGHPRSQMACGLFVLLCRRLLAGREPRDAYIDAMTVGRGIYLMPPFEAELSRFSRVLDGRIADLAEEDIQSGGYVIHTLEASIWCLLTTNGFKEAVLKAVNLGDDTDTTGAVTGGLAGIVYGVSAIPEEWLDALARQEDIMRLARQVTPAN